MGNFSFLAEMVSKYRDGDTGLGHFSLSLSDSEALSIHLQCGSVSEVKVEPWEAGSHEFKFFLQIGNVYFVWFSDIKSYVKESERSLTVSVKVSEERLKMLRLLKLANPKN